MKKNLQKNPPRITLSTPAKISLIFILHLFIGIGSIIIVLLFFSFLGSHVLDKQFFMLDSTIFRFLYPLRNPLLTQCMFGITFLGSGTFLTIAAIITIGYLLKKNQKQNALLFSFLLFSGMELNMLLKNIFQRDRPLFYPLINEPSYSFPSGHAMNAFIFYTALSFFLFTKMQNNMLGKTLVTLSFLLIFIIGVSRIYLGVHYATDVLGGFLAGFLWFLFMFLFEKSLRRIQMVSQPKLAKKI